MLLFRACFSVRGICFQIPLGVNQCADRSLWSPFCFCCLQCRGRKPPPLRRLRQKKGLPPPPNQLRLLPLSPPRSLTPAPANLPASCFPTKRLSAWPILLAWQTEQKIGRALPPTPKSTVSRCTRAPSS